MNSSRLSCLPGIKALPHPALCLRTPPMLTLTRPCIPARGLPHPHLAGMPPVVFIAMDRDPAMAARISGDARQLREMGVPTATVRVAPRVVYPTFFSDRRWVREWVDVWVVVGGGRRAGARVGRRGGRDKMHDLYGACWATACCACRDASPSTSRAVCTPPAEFPTTGVLIHLDCSFPRVQPPCVPKGQRQCGGGAHQAVLSAPLHHTSLNPSFTCLLPVCSPRVSPEVSTSVVAALHQIGMLDDAGYVTMDPR